MPIRFAERRNRRWLSASDGSPPAVSGPTNAAGDNRAPPPIRGATAAPLPPPPAGGKGAAPAVPSTAPDAAGAEFKLGGSAYPSTSSGRDAKPRQISAGNGDMKQPQKNRRGVVEPPAFPPVDERPTLSASQSVFRRQPQGRGVMRVGVLRQWQWRRFFLHPSGVFFSAIVGAEPLPSRFGRNRRLH